MKQKAPPPYLRDSTGADADIYDATHKRDLAGLDQAISSCGLCANSNLLFIGPGNGRYDLLPFLKQCRDLRVVAVEPSEAMRKQLQTELESTGSLNRVTVVPTDIDDALQSGALQLPEGARFDGIVACSVLHHLPNWRMTLHWLFQQHLIPSGWLLIDEWIPGNPLYSIDCNGSHDCEPFVRYLFADREAKTGILWDPELRGHDVSALVAFVQANGFSGKTFETKALDEQWRLDLYAPFLRGTQFAIFRWGNGPRHSAYCSSFLKKQQLIIEKPVASLRFRLFTRMPAEQPARASLGYAVQPVHLSKILSHLTTELRPAAGVDHAELRQIQVLQLAIHYGAYWAGTKWCIPIRAEIDPDTTLLRSGTAPISTFLFRDRADAPNVIARTLVNMRRLLTKTKIRSESITTELLQLIQEQEDFGNMQEAVIELRLTPGCEEVKHERQGDVEFRRVRLKASCAMRALSEVLVKSVRRWVDNNAQYRFGDFLLINLNEAYKAQDSLLDKELAEPQQTDISAPSQFEVGESDKKLIELLRGFVPMMEDGEVLRLVFSPLGKRIDEKAHRIQPLIFGAFLLLEQETPSGELRDLDAPRLGRIQVFNRLIQSDIARQQHQLSESKRIEAQTELARTEAFEKSHMLLERLQSPLRELAEALDEAQNRAQDLRTVLYEPDEVLMFSHAVVAPYFVPKQALPDQKFLPPVLIEHTPSRYSDETARLVFGRLFCRLLGKNDGFCEATKVDDFIDHAEAALRAAKAESSTKDLAVCLETFFEIEDLSNLRGKDKSVLSKALARVKATLFDPFKADSKQWPKGAILLLMEAEDFRGAQRKGLLSDNKKTNALQHKSWSPISYSTMLTFVRDIVKAWKNDNAGGHVTSVEWLSEARHCQLSLEFSGEFRSESEIAYLKTLLTRLLAFPREWRLDVVTHGDINRAFVMLVNRMLRFNGGKEEWTAPAEQLQRHELLKLEDRTKKHVLTLSVTGNRLTLCWSDHD